MFEQCLTSLFIKHHICIGGVIIHVRIKFHLCALLERITYGLVSSYPVAQFQYGRLVAREIYKRVSCKNSQHIEVIGKPPVHFIGTHLRAQIRGVNEEHHIGCILILIEHLFIVCRHNSKSVQIVTT